MSGPGNAEARMGFMEHLEELRKRLVWSLAGYAVAIGAVYAYRLPLTDFLLHPYLRYLTRGVDAAGRPVILSLGEGLEFDMRLSLWGGLILAAPWLLLQAWIFVRPALKPAEARAALPGFLALGVLFGAGVAFAYYVLLPPMFGFFMEYNRGRFASTITLGNLWEMESRFLFWSGVIFELPVAALVLGRIGVLTPGALAVGWRWAILGAFILGAIITPTGDPVNMSLMASPILLLYLVSIGTCALGRAMANRKG